MKEANTINMAEECSESKKGTTWLTLNKSALKQLSSHLGTLLLGTMKGIIMDIIGYKKLYLYISTLKALNLTPIFLYFK